VRGHEALLYLLLLSSALAAGHDTQNAQQQHRQHSQQQGSAPEQSASFPSFISSLPPVAARTESFPSMASPHAMTLRQEPLAAPAQAPMRCLVAGQIHGGRGQGTAGADGGAPPRANSRASSLEEEVRRSGSCILGFGANDAGQLALGHAASTRVPQLAEGVVTYSSADARGKNESVRVGPPIAAISAGGYHTLLLDLDGSVFSVGENFRGQLGNGWQGLASLNPVLVRNNSKCQPLAPVRGVAAGTCHSILVTTDGHVYTCGEGSDGRLVCFFGCCEGVGYAVCVYEREMHSEKERHSKRSSVCVDGDVHFHILVPRACMNKHLHDIPRVL